VRQLFRVIDWILELPAELQEGFQEELHAWEEEKRMPYITSVERYGIEKGLQQGLQQAIADVLEAKFGKAGKRLMKKTLAISMPAELRTLLKACLSAETLQEVRDSLATIQG
jgi:hypothetical protein